MAGPVGAEEEAVRVRSRLPQWLGLSVPALGLVTLMPRQVGGSVDYVVTHGIGTLPRFHTGDPAIVWGADSYKVRRQWSSDEVEAYQRFLKGACDGRTHPAG